LQGVKTEKDFQRLKRYLDTQTFYNLKDEKESFASAAKIYLMCRRKGITVSSTIDCLIVQTVLEHDLYLLHNDSDFDRIRKVVKFKVFGI
jgi:hypothetical protein